MTNPPQTPAPDSIGKIADLLPCPFCGPGESVVEAWNSAYKPGWQVGCGRCGSHSGVYWTEDEAHAGWNRRALPPLAELERLIASVPLPPKAITFEKGWELLDELQRIAVARAMGAVR